MVKTLLAAAAVLLSLQAAPAPAAPSDDAAIHAIVAAFEDGWNRHDARIMIAPYADNADFVNYIGMHWVGRGEIEKQHAFIHARNMKGSRMKIGGVRIRYVRPDVAVVRAKWSLIGGRDRAGRWTGPRTGRLLHLMTREHGRWVVQATQNTDIVEPPKPARATARR